VCQASGRQGQHPKKLLGVHRHGKVLEIGGYFNKVYNVFVNIYFMPVSLVRNLHQLSIYITGPVRRNRKLLPMEFKNKF
jgi:hypothetical protein